MSELERGHWYEVVEADKIGKDQAISVSYNRQHFDGSPDIGTVSNAKYTDGKFVDSNGVEIPGVDSFSAEA